MHRMGTQRVQQGLPGWRAAVAAVYQAAFAAWLTRKTASQSAAAL
jgi:hypothetical protein